MVIDFFDNFPRDTKIIDVHEKLMKLWTTLKKNMGKETYRYYSKLLHKKHTNFKFYMNGRRNPPLGFIKDLQMIAKEHNLNIKLKRFFGNVKVKFGHGGNAATAQLPTMITPELAYLVGAMRDGTLARSGKYEISYSQKNTEE